LLAEIEFDMARLCPDYLHLSTDIRRFVSSKLILKPNSLLGIVSAHPGEGCTTLALAISSTLSELHDNVLYLESEPQESNTLLDQLAEPEAYGLTEWLAAETQLSQSIQAVRKSRLSILPYGHANLSGTQLENAGRIRQLLCTLREQFDITVVDVPPVLTSETACALIRELDQIVIVVEANQTNVEDVAEIITLCGDVPIAGVFLNKATLKLPKWLSSILGRAV